MNIDERRMSRLRSTSRTASENAEALAISALGFLAQDSTRIERFLALSGLGPENLRRAAASPGFLAAVLDHLASDERLVVAFAAEAGCDPADILHARDILAGPPPDSSP